MLCCQIPRDQLISFDWGASDQDEAWQRRAAERWAVVLMAEGG